MPEYSIGHIGKMLGAKLLGNPSITVEKLSTDSRSIFETRKLLFFAIRGKNHDGHTYIASLIEKGVKAFVVSDQNYCADTEHISYIIVDDVVKALQDVAAMHRSSLGIPVVAITGSNGKTIVKEWLSYLVSGIYRTVKSPKSYNSQIGVPLSVWQAEPFHELALIEAGISMPGEMQALEKIIKPNIGIFTNLGNAHQQFFDTMKHKLHEKALLFADCGKVVFCSDDKTVLEEFSKINKAEQYSWSFDGSGNIHVHIQESLDDATTLCFRYKNNIFSLTVPYTDKASIENACTCAAACLAFHIDINSIGNLFSTLPPVAMRFETLDGLRQCKIINDSYSLDVNSLEIALDNLVLHAGEKKKVVILSDIEQSDHPAAVLYAKIAEMLHARKVDYVFGVGEQISDYKNLFNIESSFFIDTTGLIHSKILNSLRDSVILVKGARSFRFESIVKLLQKQNHETVLEIHLNAIEANLNYFRQKAGNKVKTMVMVKAFSYGSGYYEIAEFLQYLKVDYLAVAYTDEGVDLRRAGITTPIMVMSPQLHDIEQMIEFGLEPEIYSFGLLYSVTKAIELSGHRNYPVHIKLDTGMHRLGFVADEIDLLHTYLKNHPILEIRSVFTHLVGTGNSKHDDFTHRQVALFTDMAGSIADSHSLRHVLNSDGVLRFPQYCFNMVRIGIGLYGLATETDKLQHAGRLKTKIIRTIALKAGNSIGYNRSTVLSRDSIVATIPLGYADGLNRKLGNGNWSVLVNGKLAPIVGDICMDMCMIDITDIEAGRGDEVVVFGPELPVSQMAKVLQTISYEVLTAIPQRVKRVYYSD